MEAARQRVLVRALAVVHKKEEKKEKGKKGVSLSALKVVEKGAPKWKVEGKDDHPLKKGMVTPGDKQSKKPSPPNPSHETSKGLMIAMGPVT